MAIYVSETKIEKTIAALLVGMSEDVQTEARSVFTALIRDVRNISDPTLMYMALPVARFCLARTGIPSGPDHYSRALIEHVLTYRRRVQGHEGAIMGEMSAEMLTAVAQDFIARHKVLS
ncbi:MAG: hypothetical protein EOP83_17320 [Verrucomicrobiaceae bacterium]|nr:MAG: hypothetical protein EOP83_17320 [Verrucomicrobiaceae bacterium]